jgi:hypothetical protein
MFLMPRPKKIRLAALNIKFLEERMQTPEYYLELWQFIKNRRLKGRTLAKQAIIVSNEQKNVFEDDPQRGLYGYLYKYYDLNPNSRWIDIDRVEPLEEDEVVPIPESIKPDFKEVGYAFYPDRHVLFFDAKILTPTSAYRAFEDILSSHEVTERFGTIEVILIASVEGIEDMLALPQKIWVKIKVTIPNPEDLSEQDERVYRRLKKNNVACVNLEQRSRDEHGLELGEYEESLMRLSRTNGHTEIKVKEDGESKSYSTQEIPLLQVSDYNPQVQSYIEAVREASMGGMSTRE